VRALFWLALLAFLHSGVARADWTVKFATVAEGQRFLGQQDEYTAEMSAFDRSARMKTEREVSAEEFLAFAAGAVRAWPEKDKRSAEAALRNVRPAVSRLLPSLKGIVYLVTTNGDDEAGAPYTRGSAMVLPAQALKSEPQMLRKIVAHELFHIFSRQHPHLHDALYASIGFKPCSVELPPALKQRRIANPDAPLSRHCIDVHAAGKPVQALPVLFAKAPKYDTARGGTFLDYLAFGLMLVQEPPAVVGVKEVSGFFEQVGQNTQYIIHPEEILADNFVLLVLGEKDVPSPEVLQRFASVLSRARPQ
jgi:hypothetical protein